VTGKTWFRVPTTLLVRLEGQTRPCVYGKDVMLAVAGMLGMDGATYRSVEFCGSYIDQLPMHERIIFSNMSTEIGAKCGLIAPDQVTIDFLQNETLAVGPFEMVTAHNPFYEREIVLDVRTLEPQVACHPDVDQVKPLSEMVGLPIDQVFIGTCTNGRYEDLEIVASILKGRQVSPYTRTIITPASVRIYQKALKNGLIDIFHAAGCTIGVVGCGACIGRHGGILAPGERAFTTMNRNFIGRMGSAEAEIYLGSPAVAAATGLNGMISDPLPYLEVSHD
jgi:homoaconitase/3-isopropylmalate dehydratase large subunit